MTQRQERRVLTGQHFLNGDQACAEGAIAAGCTFFAGYPITPSTEIAERFVYRLPEVGGHFIQMEDELGSMAAVLGASWAGARAMTVTSGPGFSLMMENVGLGIMTEVPCVVVNVQRGGPSTGLPTLVGQQDVMQARWGTHGSDCEIVAYAPQSAQEMFDLTIKAFNTADKYRTPVFVMADEVVGHIFERVVIPPTGQIEVVERKRPSPAEKEDFWPYVTRDGDLVPPMPRAGDGFRIHITGLTHDERGYPFQGSGPDVAELHDRMIRRIKAKIASHADEIIECEEVMLDDAEVVVLAYGCTARSARGALRLARQAGIKAGMLRLITIWPFPEKKVAELAAQGRALIFAELNLGQMVREAERFTPRPIIWVNHAGGAIMAPEPILAAIKEAAS